MKYLAIAIILLLTACAQLLKNKASVHIVDTVAEAEQILCDANDGLPFASENIDHWLPQIVGAFCLLRDGVVMMGMTEESTGDACGITADDREKLPDNHTHAIAWDEICG